MTSIAPEELDRVPVERLRDQWSSLLSGHYATRTPDPYSRYETVLQEQPSEFLGLQIATHLESLGYLSSENLNTRAPSETWEAAFERWRSDFRATSRSRLTVTLDGEDLERMSDLERDIRLLKAVCSFEGEVSIRLGPSAAANGLPARVAAYRLRCFGFLGEGQSMGDVDWAALGTVEQELACPTFPEMTMLNLLGDLPELSSRFAQTQHARIFAFTDGRSPTEELLQRYRIRRSRRTAIGQSTFRSHAAVRRRSRYAAVPTTGRKASKPALRPTLCPGLATSSGASGRPPSLPLSRFASFLLQVRLWTYGYYRGALDGEWGLMTARALGRFIDEHEKGAGDEAIAQRSAWLAGNSQTAIIDLAYLMSYMTSRLDEAAEVTDRSEIDRLVEAALGSDPKTGKQKATFRDAEETLTAEIIRSHEERRRLQAQDRSDVDTAGAASGKRRRRYFGWRSVFSFVGRTIRWIGGTIRRTLKWIRKKIRSVVHYATSLLNYIREKTRRAVRLAALGLQRFELWLTQAPVVTRRGPARVATRYHRDFDAITLSSPNIDHGTVQAHWRRIEALNAGFGFLVEVALSVWSILSALKYSFANWLLVAWRSFQAIRRAISYIDEHEELLDRLEPAVA